MTWARDDNQRSRTGAALMKNKCQSPSCRWRCCWCLDRLSSRKGGMAGCHAVGTGRIDLGSTHGTRRACCLCTNMSYATSSSHDYSGEIPTKGLRRKQASSRDLPLWGICAWRRPMRGWMNLVSMQRPPRRWVSLRMVPNFAHQRPLTPFVRTEDLKGRAVPPNRWLHQPRRCDPSQAKGAKRQRGVIIERKWQVDGYEWTG